MVSEMRRTERVPTLELTERNCHRLKAVLDYSFCEVRPGVGPVKKMKSVIAGFGITHVTCTEGRIRVI